jgi:hypothetical protein
MPATSRCVRSASQVTLCALCRPLCAAHASTCVPRRRACCGTRRAARRWCPSGRTTCPTPSWCAARPAAAAALPSTGRGRERPPSSPHLLPRTLACPAGTRVAAPRPAALPGHALRTATAAACPLHPACSRRRMLPSVLTSPHPPPPAGLHRPRAAGARPRPARPRVPGRVLPGPSQDAGHQQRQPGEQAPGTSRGSEAMRGAPPVMVGALGLWVRGQGGVGRLGGL